MGRRRARDRQPDARRPRRPAADIWATPGATPQYYPLTHTSWWLEYRLWGDRPAGYRATNVLLHAGSAAWVALLCRRLKVGGDGEAGAWAAWVAAAAFALHPVHAESVAWVSERKNVLSGFFYLAAFFAYLGPTAGRTPPSGGRYAGAFALFAAALLSKTVTASLPAAVAVVLWWKWGVPNDRRWRVGHAVRLAPMLLAGALMGRVTAGMEAWNVGAVGPEFDLSFAERCLVAGRAAWFYAGKVVVPWPLSFVYERWRIDATDPAAYLYPAAALGAMIGLWAWRRRLGRGPAAAAMLFVGTLFPALGFVSVYPHRFSFVADHFQYLASLALIVPIAAALARLSFAAKPRAAWALAWPAVLLALTAWRSSAFASDRALWEDALAKNPSAWIAHDHLGASAREAGDLEAAAAHYAAGLAVHDHVEGRTGLASVFFAAGQRERALAEMDRAVALRPNHAATRATRAGVLAAMDRPDEAVEEYRRALALDPRLEPARLALADLLLRTGDPAGAIAEYREAIRVFPETLRARLRLGDALASLGRPAEAAEQYAAVLARRPDAADVRRKLAEARREVAPSN